MGKVAFVVGDDVSTDVIYPGRYMATVLPTETPQYAFANDPALNAKLNAKEVPPGSVLVGGKNFGCGISREHAPIAIKESGISCVIASTFARIFYRNAINIGLPIVESPEASEKISAGDKVSVDFDTGVITNHTKNETYQGEPFPTFIQGIISAGGLMNAIKAGKL